MVVSVATIMAKKKKDRLRVHKEARRLARLGAWHASYRTDDPRQAAEGAEA